MRTSGCTAFEFVSNDQWQLPGACCMHTGATSFGPTRYVPTMSGNIVSD